MPGIRGVVAGAVFGVIAVLAMLLALVGTADDRWVTRREYVAELKSINAKLSRIEDRLDVPPPPRRRRPEPE